MVRSNRYVLLELQIKLKTNILSCFVQADVYPDIKMNVKFVQDTSKFWYKPDISREQGTWGSFSPFCSQKYSFFFLAYFFAFLCSPQPSIYWRTGNLGHSSLETAILSVEPTVWRWRWPAPHRQSSRTRRVKLLPTPASMISIYIFYIRVEVVYVCTLVGDLTNELVRHFLIETSPKGVRLKGCPNEPYFGEFR